MAARVGFEPATLRMQSTELTTKPPSPKSTISLLHKASGDTAIKAPKMARLAMVCAGHNWPA